LTWHATVQMNQSMMIPVSNWFPINVLCNMQIEDQEEVEDQGVFHQANQTYQKVDREADCDLIWLRNHWKMKE